MYQVGDLVIIRPDLQRGRVYPMSGDSEQRDIATSQMVKFAGRQARIIGVSDVGKKWKIDLDTHNWTDEMFESAYIGG